MATVHVNGLATGGADGTSKADGYLHPDDIPSSSLGAGDIVKLYGPSTYLQTAEFLGKGSGGAGDPVLWEGVDWPTWTSGLDLNTIAGGTWTASAANPGAFYFSIGGSDPSLNDLSVLGASTLDGHYFESSAEETTYQIKVAGSLAVGELGWGDADSLGFSTVYAWPKNGVNPADSDIICSQLQTIFSTNFTNQSFDGILFSYAVEAVEARSGSGKWTFNRCIFKYLDFQAVFHAQDNDVDVVNCLGFFAGHRFVTKGANAADGILNVYNNIAIKTHLFGLINRFSATATTFRNNIGYLLSAGVIDAEADGGGAGTIDENYNSWYPDWTGGATDMNYPNSPGTRWLTTGANSFPPSAATTLDNVADNITAGAVAPEFNVDFSTSDLLDSVTDEDLINLVLVSGNGLLGKGTRVLAGQDVIGPNGEPMPNFEIDMGCNQSSENASHPTKL